MLNFLWNITTLGISNQFYTAMFKILLTPIRSQMDLLPHSVLQFKTAIQRQIKYIKYLY
jgi:hypothetical protein